MAQPEPLFTVVTINFNNAAELAQTIDSVSAQKFPSKEYIVVDGGSTDGSLALVDARRDAIDRVISEPDCGIYDAMNKGVALAHGKWILFLNSGDILVADDVLMRVAAVAQDLEADILLGDAIVRYLDGTRRLHKAERPEEIPYGMICSHQSMFVRRPLLATTPFSIGKMRSDYEFILRAWRHGLRFQTLGFVIASVSAGGWSDRSRIRSLRERWTMLHEAGAFSPKLLAHFGLSFFLAVLAPIAKSVLPGRTISTIRKLKVRYLGARSSRG